MDFALYRSVAGGSYSIGNLPEYGSVTGCSELRLSQASLAQTPGLSEYTGKASNEAVALLGDESRQLSGYLNGISTSALPDTGSNVMLVSTTYAKRHGLKVDEGLEDLLEVEFADGSTAWTSGVVRDASWSVCGKTIRCDFHVLDSLCVDVVLNNDYLFDNGVFSEFEEYFFDADTDGPRKVCNIRLIDKYGKTLDTLEKESEKDLNSPGAFGPKMTQGELARRDKIRDEICALPED
ncbi:hypothetical protein BDW74DRAFT_178545 [Aspergillus multicolor]|uniref:retropepsin-like aspartic protease n=1 Tax=Aspergillus multicolor TaxID=41759 RepID=UPI003CCDB05F